MPTWLTRERALYYARKALLFATGLRRRHLSLGGGPLWDTGGTSSLVVGTVRALLSLAWRLVAFAFRLAWALVAPEAAARWVTGIVALQVLLGNKPRRTLWSPWAPASKRVMPVSMACSISRW